MYRKHTDDFPRESRDAAYEDRIKQTYPIHPELSTGSTRTGRPWSGSSAPAACCG